MIRWTGRRGAGGCWVAAAVAAAGETQGTFGQCTRWRASCSTCSGRLPSSAVLFRISDRRRGGASSSSFSVPCSQLVHRQSVLPRREQRQVPTVAVFLRGFRSVAVH